MAVAANCVLVVALATCCTPETACLTLPCSTLPACSHFLIRCIATITPPLCMRCPPGRCNYWCAHTVYLHGVQVCSICLKLVHPEMTFQEILCMEAVSLFLWPLCERQCVSRINMSARCNCTESSFWTIPSALHNSCESEWSSVKALIAMDQYSSSLTGSSLANFPEIIKSCTSHLAFVIHWNFVDSDVYRITGVRISSYSCNMKNLLITLCSYPAI